MASRQAPAGAGGLAVTMVETISDQTPDGRPWYHTQYYGGLGSCIPAMLRLVLCPVLVILPFYMIYVVWKVVALFVFYIIFFPHLIFELRDRRLRTDTKVEAGAGERGGNVGWQIYKMAAGYLLFTPVYAFIIGIAAPVTHLLCRPEAASRLVAVAFVEHLDWDHGWTIPAEQFLLNPRRKNAAMMAIRRFDERGRPLSHVLLTAHQELQGLSQLTDTRVMDRLVNRLILMGAMLDREEKRDKPHWTEFACRYVAFCASKNRTMWTSGSYAAWRNWWLGIANSQAASFVSVRFANKFHPLTRNERLLISLERIALSLFFTTLLVLQPDNNGLSTVYGIISFVVIFSQTQIARATCHNGVAKQCKGCGCCCGLIGQCCCKKCCSSQGFDVETFVEVLIEVVLWFFFILFLSLGIIVASVVMTGNTATAISTADKEKFGKKLINSVLISEGMAWVTGTLLHFVARRTERRRVERYCKDAGLEGAVADEYTTSQYYMEKFLHAVAWPEDLMGEPTDYTAADLTAKLHPQAEEAAQHLAYVFDDESKA